MTGLLAPLRKVVTLTARLHFFTPCTCLALFPDPLTAHFRPRGHVSRQVRPWTSATYYRRSKAGKQDEFSAIRYRLRRTQNPPFLNQRPWIETSPICMIQRSIRAPSAWKIEASCSRYEAPESCPVASPEKRSKGSHEAAV